MRVEVVMKATMLNLAVVIALTAAARPSRASQAASDNANNGYSGNWTTINGGSGFAAWSIIQTNGGGGFFTGASTNNNRHIPPGIDTNNKSWGMYCSGAVLNTNYSRVRRQFTAGATSTNILQVGQIFAVSMDNGSVATNGIVGFALQNSNTNDVFSWKFVGGSTNYCTNSVSSLVNINNSGVHYTNAGVTVVFTLTSASQFQLQIYSPGTNPAATTYTAQNLMNSSGGEAIDRVILFTNGSGSGSDFDLFFNSMSISCPPLLLSTQPTNLMVCAGSAASFTAVASNSVSAPVYQWQRAGVNLGNGGTISGVTSSTLSLSSVSSSDATNYTCILNDACGNSATSSVAKLTVTTITILPTTLPNVSIGALYNQTVSASGGTGPYTFSIVSGTLPIGLTLNPSTGAITGIYNGAPGSASFTIQATDQGALGCSASRSYTINMVSCPTIGVSGNPAAGTVATVYSDSSISASGGTSPYTFTVSAGSLPNGLALNATTAIISGNPMASGTFSFTILANDANGCSGTTDLSIVIDCPAITVSSATLPGGTVSVAYSQTVSAGGGNNSFTFSVTSGALPTGLSLDAATGVISGSPTAAGMYNFAITATDSSTCTGSQDHTLTISCPTPNSALAVRGATVPWTTYEAENMINTGTILGPTYTTNLVSTEASGRQCVRLGATGQYVQFAAQSNANAIVVRYSVPDTADGVGADYTLSLYTNGVFAAKLPVTSKYSWLYGAYPFTNNPNAGSPRNFFDEVRTNGWSINAGDVVKLQKDSTDTASYYDIDLVDLENVAAPISQPAGSVSIKSYGAVGDGLNDDTSALQNCINATNNVWLPAGNYKIAGTINLPSNLTIHGAGMWYTTLVGDPALYATDPSRRITLSGTGSNIVLSDFAIAGKLNYRNPSEPNDGLAGSYGTGSTISNIWVEHTRHLAWIVNSQGLLINACRARNTLADGINLAVGMQSTIVTNCTARGTGDDCFAIYPGTYTSQTYTPGLNVFTHCTGRVPFLANGGAIYGGVSNTIEDCLFQDMPYGCGILISTTFGGVMTNSIIGASAQRCDLIRCGGFDPFYQWRAALQLCLDTVTNGISGVNLNNLNIMNSVSDGLSIIGDTGALSNAIMSYVTIPNYGVGVDGRNALWARNDAIGSMTVSNCTVVEYKDVSPNFTFNFVTTSIPVTVQTSSSGLSFMVDGTSYTSAQVFSWTPGSDHTITAISPQGGSAGVQYVWSSWSDCGAISHTVAPTTGTSYIATFTNLQVQTMLFLQQPGNVLEGATITPEVQVQAFDTNGQALVGVTVSLSLGSGAGTLAGTLTRVTDSTGIAHFNDLSVNTAGPKTLIATVSGNSASSAPFMVNGPAVALAFTTQPGSAVDDQPFGQQPVVKTVDAFGNPTTLGLPASLMVYVSLTNGVGSLLGTTSLDIGTSAGNGAVTFSNLAIDTAGPGNQLIASTASASITNPVSGMSIWLDGSVPSSVLTNASSVVTNWLDLSGHGNNFDTTIGGGGGGIVYVNTAATGRRTVTFNATSSSAGTELKNTTYTNTSKTISVFIVAKKTAPGTNEGGYQHVFATWVGGANPDYADVGSYSLDYNQSNSTPRIIRGCCTAYVDNNCPVMDPSANYHVFEYVANGTGSNSIWLATAGNTTQGTGPFLGNISTNFNIVASSVGGGMVNGATINNPFAGSIAEVLVYNSALSTADRTSVANYLTNKWLTASDGFGLNSALSTAFDVQPRPVSVTVQPNLTGLSFIVDGTPYTNAQAFSWTAGSNHTVATTSPQSGSAGVRYVWSSWTDGGAISHTVAPTSNTTYTANFTTQYYLTMNAGAGGSVSPASSWNDSGTMVGISAIVSNGYTFSAWAGSGSGSYSGTSSSTSVTMNGPITEAASFALIPTRLISLIGDLAFGSVTVGSSSKRTFTINNTGNSTLTVSNITYPDGFSGDWSGAIPSGGSTNLTVTFSPLVATNYGGNLTIDSDATSGVNTLAVSGTGMSTNDVSALAILAVSVNADSSVTLIYATTPGCAYHVEVTPNLAPASWTILPGSATNATGSSVTFTDTSAPGNHQLFYRVGSP